MAQGVKRGEGIAEPMRKAGMFPPLAAHLLTSAKRPGRLDHMFARMADIYETDTRAAIKRSRRSSSRDDPGDGHHGRRADSEHAAGDHQHQRRGDVNHDETTKRNRRRTAQAGVTLIEMLVVVTIIALFAALVAPRLFKQGR